MRTEKEIQEALSRVLADPKPIRADFDNDEDYFWARYYGDGQLMILRWVLEEAED